ncbi:MAG: retron system putative HNH endonuclease [Pseudanabaena sp.]
MKHIVKQQEPQLFSIWKTNPQNTYERFKKTSATDENSPKKVVKDALLKEQGYVCCYCERRISSLDSHFEHFRPQSDTSVDPLDFTNLLCSCIKELSAGDPSHCGYSKKDWFDEHYLVSPFDPNCEKRLSYTADGEISPTDPTDEAAKQTISKLKLDIPNLTERRRLIIKQLHDDIDLLSPEEFHKFVMGYLERDTHGMFGEFWTTIKYLYEQGNL